MHLITRRGVAAIVCAVLAGCAGPGPRLFPIAPVDVKHRSDGVTERWYNFGGHADGDRIEEIGPDGRMTRIGYADDPAHIEYVTLSDIPAAEQKHLVLLLDSVPFRMVQEAYEGGRFRYCYPPGRTIAPFPVMTDVSFSDFFGSSPSPGIESAYFNGEKLTSGYDTYAAGGNVPWQKYVDYRLNPTLHPEVYTDPYPWLDHELKAIKDGFLETPNGSYVGYSVSTSAVGARYGRNGHQIAIARVDRLCQDLLFLTRGKARFTLLSDHGHAFFDRGVRIPLSDLMDKMGYHAGRHLRRFDDVIIPEFGMVSSAVIHTRRPADAARDALGIEGIEIAAYLDGADLVVTGHHSLARISHEGGRWRYKPVQGDPLELEGPLDTMAQKGQVDDHGFVGDAELFAATVDATYPDAVQRLWRAFHGLVEHSPDVVLSMDQRYYVGAPSMELLMQLVGIHGSLRQFSSSGFAMTMAGNLPPVERMPDLRTSLLKLGVPIGGVDNASIPHALR